MHTKKNQNSVVLAEVKEGKGAESGLLRHSSSALKWVCRQQPSPYLWKLRTLSLLK